VTVLTGITPIGHEYLCIKGFFFVLDFNFVVEVAFGSRAFFALVPTVRVRQLNILSHDNGFPQRAAIHDPRIKLH
jgi:hypothetical protein